MMVPELYQTLVAAGGHIGAMIALIPAEADAQRIAVDDGESADELHVTLGYLGEAALIPVEVRRWLVDCVSKCVEQKPTVVGNAFSVNLFNPEDKTITAGGGEPCVVLGVGGEQLQVIRTDIMWDVRTVFDRAGLSMPVQHQPWVPHITLVYTGEADLTYFTDRMGPVTFDTVRLAFGGDVYDIPLGDNAVQSDEDMVASGEVMFSPGGEPIVPNMLVDLVALAKEKDVNLPGGSGHQLRNYWVNGKGAAKIAWKTPGDFTRCVSNLSKYVKDPKGLCAEYHHAATGMWPGDKRNPGMDINITAANFNPDQPRDTDGQWTDGSGSGRNRPNLPKPTDSGSLWKNRKEYVGTAIAISYDKNGDEYGRLTVIDGPKGPIIRPEIKMANGTWSGEDDGYRDIKSVKKLKDEIEDAPAWARYDFIDPVFIDEKKSSNNTSESEVKPKAEYVEPLEPMADEPGYSLEEQVNLAVSDAPDGWSSGSADSAVMVNERRATKSWTEDQRQSLYGYTIDATTYNNTFRENNGKKPKKGVIDQNGLDIREATDLIDSAMYPLPRQTTVFRQATTRAFGINSIDDLNTLVGQELRDFGYLSTSVNFEQNLSSISDIHIKIDVPKGKKGAYVADVSMYPEQSELLLARGTKVKIQSVEYKNGRAFVTMKVV